MKKERMMLPVALLQLNEGQLDWMPKNPRQWTQDGVNKAKDSLERDPDFLDDRPLLVVPHEGAYVVYAGNMRLTAARELGVEALPCVSYEPESVEDRDTIKRRAILDNGDFGAWDWDALANEWDDLPLGDWGVPNWGNDDEEEEPTDLDAEPRNKPFVLKVTFPTADKMNQFVAAYKDVLENDYGCTISETGGEL